MNIKPGLERNTKAQGDIASNTKSIEEKIKEGVTLLVEREKDGKNIFKCWTCNEYGHYASKCPKREKRYNGNHKPRKDRDFLYGNEDYDYDEQVLSLSDDNIRFLAIKE